MLIGNVVKDADIRYIDSGQCVASLDLATNTPGYTLANGIKIPERTEFHRVVLWKKMAEFVEKYVHKGDKLFIEGELRTRYHTDKKGVERKITEIWASQLEMLSSK